MNLEDIHTLHLDKHKFYFVLPWGLGDTMIFCGLKNALEEKLGGEVHFIIKPSHALIMQMYGIQDYTTVKVTYSYPHHSPVLVELAAKNPYPEKGKFFVAHPEFHPRFSQMVYEMQANLPHIRFLSWYKQFLDIPDAPFAYPRYYPKVSQNLEKRLLALVPDFSFEKTVLILPEATSVLGPSRLFWTHLIKMLKKKNFIVLTNIIDTQKQPLFEGTVNIDLSLEELVALSLACHDVYALRSGICDLIFTKENHLHIYYPTEAIRNIFSLKDMFQAKNVDEILLSEKIIVKHGWFSHEISFIQSYNHIFEYSWYKFLGITFLSKRGFVGV